MPPRARLHSSQPAHSQATRPGGAVGQSPHGHWQPAPSPPCPHREAQPAAALRVLHRPPGLLSVILLHHLAPASPSLPSLKLPPSRQAAKGRKMGGWAGEWTPQLPVSTGPPLLSLRFLKETKLVSRLRQGFQLQRACRDRWQTPRLNKAPEASKEQ